MFVFQVEPASCDVLNPLSKGGGTINVRTRDTCKVAMMVLLRFGIGFGVWC